MILCDSEIKAALHHGQLVIDPLPINECIATSSIDLTLGCVFKCWNAPSSPVDPVIPYMEIAKENLHDVPANADGSVCIAPRDFILAITEETIHLPPESRLAARIEGRSSLARLGLGIHVTAPTIHAGFIGKIMLEVTNVGPLTILLKPGLKACQLIVEQVFGTPAQELRSAFQGQKTVVGSS